MPLTNPDIIQTLVDKFGEALTEFGEPYGMLTFSAPREMNMEVMRFLYEGNLGFQFLTDICAVHYPERKGEELAVVYHMHNLVENIRLRFKVYLPVDQPD